MQARDVYESGSGDSLIKEGSFTPAIRAYVTAEKLLVQQCLDLDDLVLVEIGCMNGRYVEVALEGNASYVGIDTVERYIHAARERAQARSFSNTLVEFHHADASDIERVLIQYERKKPEHSPVLLLYSFNSFGNIANVNSALDALERTRCSFLVCGYLTDEHATAARKLYYNAAGLKDLVVRDEDTGQRITSVEGLNSIAYHPKWLIYALERRGFAVECFLLGSVGIAYFGRPTEDTRYVPRPDAIPKDSFFAEPSLANSAVFCHRLRPLAVAAPHHQQAPRQSLGISGKTPYSLQNALRAAAHASSTPECYWGGTIWSDMLERRKCVLLMHDLESGTQHYGEMLRQYRPNLLLIGAMTLSFPGAIELARQAKAELGNEVLVVLGGKHPSETVYRSQGRLARNRNSPIELMMEGKIPRVFDLVISGDGEDVIMLLGNQVGRIVERGYGLADLRIDISNLGKATGHWVAAWIEEDSVRYAHGDRPLNYDELPSAVRLFGTDSQFSILRTELTAHIHTDSIRGCPMDCSFCSERRSVNPVRDSDSRSAVRLALQLEDAETLGRKARKSISAFCEDAIFLNGNIRQWDHFVAALRERGINVPFGIQLTLDLVLKPGMPASFRRLQRVGLAYVFFGMETYDETLASTMHKNRGSFDTWVARNERAMALMARLGIRCGISIMFGLGESHECRLQHLQKLEVWQREYGVPNVVSLNVATQHPLRGLVDVGYTYERWGIEPRSARREILSSLFAEASELYPLHGCEIPEEAELRDIDEIYRRLTLEH